MGDVVLFVHGTGVRERAWEESFAVVKQRLLDLDPSTRVSGCFWGGSEGAQFNAGGVSIPSLRTGGDDPSGAEENLALWAVLYIDPWFEIRLLGNWPADSGELALGQVAPSDRLKEQIETFVPSEELSQLLARYDLGASFDSACAALRAAPEFDRTVETVTEATLNEYRKAVARALVAFMTVGAEDSGAPPIDGAAREEIVTAVIDDLHGSGLGVAAWLTRPFKGIAQSMVTQPMARRLGALTNATSPTDGDIMHYQVRGSGIRRYIRQGVADIVATDPGSSVTLLAHSLGGIACVDALIEAPIPGVGRLVTVGSQAPFFYEIDALTSLSYGEPLPDHFPAWLNIYDGRDLLSFIGAELFPGRVTDLQVDNGQPFPQAHNAYWRNDAMWRHIGRFLGNGAAGQHDADPYPDYDVSPAPPPPPPPGGTAPVGRPAIEQVTVQGPVQAGSPAGEAMPTASEPTSTPSPQTTPEPAAARRRRTYVNVGFAAAENARQVIEPDRLAPGHDVWVWVEIGPRAVGAVPGDVQPIDPEVMKDLDEVEVVLFPDGGLIVAPDPAVGRLNVTASGPFRVRHAAAIPPHAGPLTAQRLFFAMTTPAQPGDYRLRCAVYAKGLLLHVEQLTVVVGPSRRSISARTTFRLVRDLAAVDHSEIREHRLSIYANAQPDGSHAFSFRGVDGQSSFTRQVRLGDSDVNTALKHARAALHHASWRSDEKYDGQSSKYDESSRGGFAPDLATADVISLARSGYNLWLQFAEQLPSDEGDAAASPEPAGNNLHDLRDLMREPGGAVQLAPIKGPDLIVPIQLFYDRLLDSSETAPLQLCSNGAAWIGSSAEEMPCLAGCSEPTDPNRVCPAGFWGLRHLVSVTPEPRDVCRRRSLPPKVSLKSGVLGVAGFTTDKEVLDAAGEHERRIQQLLKVRQAAYSRDEFKAELETVPAQVVYVLCHVANYETVPELILGRIDDPGINYGTLVDHWTPNLCAASPLVVLNACNSAAPSPERLLSLVTGFLRRGAAGAIGTEITVFVSLAVPFAEHFLQSFVNGVSLGEAIRRARVAMLARGNPLGLAYIAFGLPQLALLPD